MPATPRAGSSTAVEVVRCATAAPGSSVITASTPSSQAQVEVLDRVHRPAVDPASRSRRSCAPGRGFSGAARSRGRRSSPCRRTRTPASQGVCRLDQQHHLELRREPLDPAQRDPEKLMTRTGESCRPSRSRRAARRACARPGRRTGGVLGLDRQVDRPVVVRDRLEQPAQRQHPAVLGSRSGASSSSSVQGWFQEAKSRSSSWASAIVETTPRSCVSPAQAAVVHADQVPVRGQPHVALEALGTLVEGREVGAPGCARPRGAGPAVCDHLRPGRDHARHSAPTSARGQQQREVVQQPRRSR